MERPILKLFRRNLQNRLHVEIAFSFFSLCQVGQVQRKTMRLVKKKIMEITRTVAKKIHLFSEIQRPHVSKTTLLFICFLAPRRFQTWPCTNIKRA